MGAPTDVTLPQYIELMKKKNCTYCVRTCEKTYSTEKVEEAGIKVMIMEFKDGDPPSEEIITNWLSLCEAQFSKEEKNCIAVHCVAGVGRSPVLVCIALIEDGMEPIEAITFARKHRPGAINAKQLKYLQTYKRRKKKKDCIIM